jgi:hypothetical protein
MVMQKLAIEDTWNILEYEKIRDEFRRRIITLKKTRRVAVGDHISLVFENRDTALFQIQEMIRVERLVHEDRIAHELEVYNALIPDQSELSATLFVEAQDRPTMHTLLQRLVGLDQHVTLRIGEEFAILARFEAGRSGEDQISSIQYLRFPFNDAEREAFDNGHEPVAIVIDHPYYRATATLPAETRASLVADLA